MWQCIALGAAGGALVEVLAILSYLLSWQGARRTKFGLVRKVPPRWRLYVDVPAHVLLLIFRMPLGAATAWLFTATGQISGPYAALAFGVAAPAVLAQLGQLPQVERAVKGAAQGELPPAAAAPTSAMPSERPVAPSEQEVEQP